MSASRIALILKSFASRFGKRISKKIALYSSTAVLLGGAGVYTYHSAQLINSYCITSNPISKIASFSKMIYHDHASSANTNKKFERITIPSGKATVINYNQIQNESNLRHVLITVQGEGEVQFQPTNQKILYGTENQVIPNQVIHKELKLGKSVGIPATNWHQILNKHDSTDLVLVVTSLPANDESEN